MNIDLKPENKIPEGFFDFPLPVVRILYEAEQPIVYLTKTKQGQGMLAYLSSEDETSQYIVVAPITETSLRRLETGSVGIRETLTDSWMWLVKEDYSSDSLNAWSISEEEIPSTNLPKPGTPLLAEHRIAFSARAIGEGIELGQVPCSVIAFVATAAKSSLKALLDHAFSANGEGRPTDAQRALYDLPVQQLRFASFEVGLGDPRKELFPNETVLAAMDDLKKGLEWAEDVDGTEGIEEENEAKTEAILRATLALTPPSQGAITSIEVGGSWLKEKRFTLTRKSRSKVAGQLRKMKEEEIVVLFGRIGEIDDDKLSFILRDIQLEEQELVLETERRCSFSEDLLDDMRLHYFEQNRIKISGLIRSGKLRVTAAIPQHENSVS